MGTNNSDFYLPVYVINLKERTERRQHIEEQFQGRVEFGSHWIRGNRTFHWSSWIMAKHAKGCTNSYRQKG